MDLYLMNEEMPAYVNEQWNVFITRNILTRMRKCPGILTGFISKTGLIVAIDVVGNQCPPHKAVLLPEDTIGFWHGEEKNENIEAVHLEGQNVLTNSIIQQIKQQCTVYVDLLIGSCNQSVACDIYFSGSGMLKKPPFCIEFEPGEILNSYILMKEESKLSEIESQAQKEKSFYPKWNHVLSENLADILKHAQQKTIFNKAQKTLKTSSSDSHSKLKRGIVWKMFKSFITSVPLLIMTMFSSFHQVFDPRVSNSYLKNVCCIPSFPEHLVARSRRSNKILNLSIHNSLHIFIKYNAFAQHAFESLFGIAVLYYAIDNNWADLITSSVMMWADDVASRSGDLINWLMGAPAGLKLNSQLTNILGQFFLYHIYLWTGYLVILRRVLPWMLVFAFSSGVLGITFQLCFIKDIISMLTLHIYCFYVYAARIFHLQVSALASLWRLFRGKKWNVLRSRVDSAVYNTDQLFAGTLMFTVLLFLLPTTAMYYAVFTGLRCVTIVAQGILSKLIELISATPVFSLILYVFKPEWIAGAVEFEMMQPSSPPSNLLLTMKTCRLPFADILSLTSPYLKENKAPVYSWFELLNCIATGRIMYPWVDVTEGRGKVEEKEKKD